MDRKIDKVGKLIKIGNSRVIIIDKDTLDYLGLDIGDMVKIQIEKVKPIRKNKNE